MFKLVTSERVLLHLHPIYIIAQLPGLTKARMCKPIQTQLLFPTDTMDAVVSDHVELDFDDVFGPLPVQVSVEVNYGDSANSAAVEDATELIYDNPVPIIEAQQTDYK
ncbi:serine/threonine-protein kinase AtPK2/AtPK19 [Prunus yedoensis var. nudiflora]|uniref:Serine/threonine-protein kinase AtPK2/AtPK19 n=1 Tax=Prunus yedoensis var. nudiflora TaxID=2094558 RepID=A0A314Y9F4_PRUYE|nr:serine/threonine-protein kinase AtPK2/AtPK19 [Prunus yedoensis var. nudiflora]